MVAPKVLILGGTGATGLVTLEKALAAGFEVTAYARTPSKFPSSVSSQPNLKIIQGSFTDDESLSNAIKGQDVILSLVGPNTFTGPGDTFTRAYRLIFKLMREHEVSRIYALATFSVYDPLDEFSILRSLLVWFIWAVVHNAWMEFVGIGRVFEEEATDLDWTVFRVGWLVPGEGRETVAGYIGDGKIVLHVRRIEIARWLVDEVQKGAEDWIQQRPGLASGPKVKAE